MSRLTNHLFIENSDKRMVGIFIGRMSPPTFMHQKIINDAIRKYSKVYIFIIEGEKSSGEAKNFLTFEDRTDLLKITNHQASLILARHGYIPDIISDEKINTSNGIAIIAGSDRIEGYKSQFKGVNFTVKFDEIPRDADAVSASRVRKALEDNDFETYKRSIAKGLDNEKWFVMLQKAYKVKRIGAKIENNQIPLLDYLSEVENKHIEHYEDNIFIGEAGIKKNLEIAKTIRDALSGKAEAEHIVTVKWDGAPAVIFGINPENNKFFVSTKSLFNKTPKIAYTNKDIDEQFEKAGLNDKLKTALKYLPAVCTSGIYQGDLLFTDNMRKVEEISGDRCVTFTPNTITYAIPMKSNLGREIIKADIGLIVHTKYKGNIGNLSASFDVKSNQFKQSKNVWLQDATIKDYSGIVNFDNAELERIEGIINAIEKTDINISELKKGNIFDIFKVYKNTRIKSGIGIIKSPDMVDDFKEYLIAQTDIEVKKMKNDQAKKNKEDDLEETLAHIENVREDLRALFSIYNWFVKLKMYIVRRLDKIKGIGTFLRDGEGYKVTSPEGFCVVSNDNSILKIIDRLEFSRSNFLMQKDWK